MVAASLSLNEIDMPMFWDLVNAALRKPLVAAFAVVVVIVVLGALVGLLRTVV